MKKQFFPMVLCRGCAELYTQKQGFGSGSGESRGTPGFGFWGCDVVQPPVGSWGVEHGGVVDRVSPS